MIAATKRCYTRAYIRYLFDLRNRQLRSSYTNCPILFDRDNRSDANSGNSWNQLMSEVIGCLSKHLIETLIGDGKVVLHVQLLHAHLFQNLDLN